jgi:hypothetical protein
VTATDRGEVVLPHAVAAAALVGRELIPLYLQFIDDLAGRFRRCRARLRA